ncbi:sugar phosphate nucleotidyltransferase [Streptomyces sp. NPDC054770]
MNATSPAVGAVVLAAGEGRRLGPLTRDTPKPLLTVLDTPLLDLILARVAETSPRQTWVGLSHRAEAVEAHLRATGQDDTVRFRTEDRLSGPAGALHQFTEDLAAVDVVLVVSGDIVFNDSLPELVRAHTASSAAMTFAALRVTRAHRYGVLDVDSSGTVQRTREKPDVPPEQEHWVSAGIYCLRPEVLRRVPAGAECYDFAAHLAPELIADGHRVRIHPLGGYWNDVGRPAALRDANLDAARGLVRGLRPRRPAPQHSGESLPPEVHVGVGAVLEPGSRIAGPAVIGAGARVAEGSTVHRSVLLPRAATSPGGHFFEALVGADTARGAS